MPRSFEEQILDRLDQLVRVSAIQVAADQSMTERARLLKLAGLDNQTIAEILKTNAAVIRTLTSNLHRRTASAERRKPRSRRARGPRNG